MKTSITHLCCVSLFLAVIFVASACAEESLKPVHVFVGGQDGYFGYRIPSLITSRKGTLLAFCEGRKTNLGDDGDNDLLLRRSTDGGKTWQPQQLVHEEGGDAIITVGNPCAVEDHETGRLWLTMNRKNERVLVTHSDDDGLTWAAPTDITRSVSKPDWGWYAMGPGVGIVLEHGPHRGRLIFPANHRHTKNRSGPSSSHIIFSDDHGKTWQLGGIVAPHTNECQVVETLAENGDGLLINMRNHLGRSGKMPERAGRRLISRSRDGGSTWSQPAPDDALIEPTCQASLIRYLWSSATNPGILLFSNPGSASKRANMTVRVSYDEGETWPESKAIDPGPSGYSCLTRLRDGRIGLIYESDNYKKLTFVAFSLDWLLK